MPVIIEQSAPEELRNADLRPRGRVFPSPGDWRDQVFYFILPDRFNDDLADQRPRRLRRDGRRSARGVLLVHR